jgi:hypothetical protein
VLTVTLFPGQDGAANRFKDFGEETPLTDQRADWVRYCIVETSVSGKRKDERFAKGTSVVCLIIAKWGLRRNRKFLPDAFSCGR